jgi:hypothetical protein
LVACCHPDPYPAPPPWPWCEDIGPIECGARGGMPMAPFPGQCSDLDPYADCPGPELGACCLMPGVCADYMGWMECVIDFGGMFAADTYCVFVCPP